MNSLKSTVTLTFGDSAENHVGMEQLGKRVAAGEGFTVGDLSAMKARFEGLGAVCELHMLHEGVEGAAPAAVLVIRKGVDVICGGAVGGGAGGEVQTPSDAMFAEQAALNVDKQAFMYGRVVNKHARWNLCFDSYSQEPVYEEGKGRIVAFDDLPLTRALHAKLPEMFGEKAADLKGEGNYYYDIAKCGIGYHGDSERRKVVGVRLGATMPFFYQWYQNGVHVGERVRLDLNGGDVYVMSEKAVGTDWKSKKILTLRHSAGCDKFTTVVEKVKKVKKVKKEEKTE